MLSTLILYGGLSEMPDSKPTVATEERAWCTNEQFELYVDLFAAHRKRLESMTDAEYRAYKQRQAEACANAG
jgi:hypothetical protein